MFGEFIVARVSTRSLKTLGFEKFSPDLARRITQDATGRVRNVAELLFLGAPIFAEGVEYERVRLNLEHYL